MDNLPTEVVVHILGFLPSLTDRQAASQVSHAWYSAYQHPKFRQNEVVEITNEDQMKTLSRLVNPHRSFPNFVIKECELNTKVAEFWNRFGDDMKSLAIFNCEMNQKTFTHLITQCTHLRELSILNCRDLFLSQFVESEESKTLIKKCLKNVTMLNLSSNRYLTDGIFNTFMQITGNLQYLFLSGCPISFHPGLYKRFYPQNQTIFEPSSSVLTFHVILQGISTKTEKLKYLNFSDTLIDSRAVGLLVELSNLKLDALILRSCQQLSKEGVSKICVHQKWLTELDLSLCPRITDASLKDICSNLTNLKNLSVRKCKAITDLGVSEVRNLKQLEKLNISECDAIMGSGIITAFNARQNMCLRELRSASLANITESTLISVARCLPNLTHLDVSYCVNAVTDNAIQEVILCNKKLKVLVCTMCNKVTDSGLIGVVSPSGDIDTNPHRVHLGSKAEEDIIKDAKLKKSIKMISDSEKKLLDCLRNLKDMEELYLSGCTRVSDTSLKHAIKFISLRNLDISNCPQVTSDGIVYLTINNPSIETLNIDNCANVTDTGVEAIAKNLKRLKTLILGSPKITFLSVARIAEYCQNLKYLDIRACAAITPESEHVSTLFYRLQTFHYKSK